MTRQRKAISSETVAKRSAQGLRLSGRRHRQDPRSQRRIQQGRIAHHQGLRRPAGDRRFTSRQYRPAGPALRQDPHPGERHGRVAARGRGRAYAGARRTTRRSRRFMSPRANANGSSRKPRRRPPGATSWRCSRISATLADRYEVRLRSTTRANMAPDEAILREAKRGYDLIVLGRQPAARRYAILRQYRSRGA